MRFYDRIDELNALNSVHKLLDVSCRLSVVTGRRRIGKTRLIQQFCAQYESLYFFVSHKSEELLCEEYLNYIQHSIGIPIIGKITKLIDVFRMLFEVGKDRPLIVVMDEFQELLLVNPSFYSEFQNLWDAKKAESHLHIIVSGSVYSLMHKIFLDYKQPLYGRADIILNLKPLPLATIAEILKEENVFSSQNILSAYLLTGGVPRYLEILRDHQALSNDQAIEQVFSQYSVFAEEGKNILIEEFGKDYGVYFSILELIATGKNSRIEMESILQSSVGGYLERLEESYSLVAQYRPFNAKKGSRFVKYKLYDPFLAFWFAYFHRYRSAVESSNMEYVKQRFLENYPQFAGYWLERLYADIFKQSGKYHMVGSYWESGYQNEIDLVALDEVQKKLVLAEIKMQAKNIRKEKLQNKAQKLIKEYSDYKIEYLYLGMEDLQSYIGG